MTHTDNSTICAIATPPGGALGIIRVSGTRAIEAVDRLFRPANGKPLAQRGGNTTAFGTIAAGGETVDEVVATLFRAPHSYTGEDSVEISCHGSAYIMNRIVQLLASQDGCRVAQPGEYTLRAFINGKMDLSQAEAVADVIASTSKAAHDVAVSQMRGGFSRKLKGLREKLLHLTSLMELELDFSDHEELEFADRSELKSLCDEIETEISRLCNSFAVGNAMKELHRREISVSISFNGITFRFIDTAGIRDTSDKIESIGIERTFKAISQASVVLLVLDASIAMFQWTELSEKVLPLCKDKHVIVVFNKTDLIAEGQDALLKRLIPDDMATAFISAKEKRNIPTLQQLIVQASSLKQLNDEDVIVTNTRHFNALSLALASIHRVSEGLANDIPSDLVSQDLRECIYHLSDIAGEVTTDAVLANIFERFCIGK